MKDPDDKIRACHGTVMKSHCPNCELKTGSAFYDSISGTGAVVLCPRCRGAIRPDITLFGESLPEDVFRDSFADFRNCDLLLVCRCFFCVCQCSRRVSFKVMGTSLKVYPVAGLVNRVTDTTARVLINREVVGNFNSSYRDVKLIGDIDKQVSEAVKILGWQ
jgi:NAD-dependent SIR2 family protein deacetylase